MQAGVFRNPPVGRAIVGILSGLFRAEWQNLCEKDLDVNKRKRIYHLANLQEHTRAIPAMQVQAGC